MRAVLGRLRNPVGPRAQRACWTRRNRTGRHGRRHGRDAPHEATADIRVLEEQRAANYGLAHHNGRARGQHLLRKLRTPLAKLSHLLLERLGLRSRPQLLLPECVRLLLRPRGGAEARLLLLAQLLPHLVALLGGLACALGRLSRFPLGRLKPLRQALRLLRSFGLVVALLRLQLRDPGLHVRRLSQRVQVLAPKAACGALLAGHLAPCFRELGAQSRDLRCCCVKLHVQSAGLLFRLRRLCHPLKQ
mmetsp:Transcript_34560/g.93611  ORF Transcript_34560/g.93611 Transcript_34560/m.93611 type:complete len:247 (-) Transcript_34560:925-1665(-)